LLLHARTRGKTAAAGRKDMSIAKRCTVLGVALASLLAMPAMAADIKLIAPAAPGGGWDGTARSMQQALQAEKLANVQVENIPGAGGTIGLAQFVNRYKGDPNTLIVSGYVMVGAIIANKSAVTLDQVVPIARLTGEYQVLVVPTASPLKSIGDFVELVKKDIGKVSWAGGSAGGTDHITAGLIAKAVGADPKKVNYIAFSGGGEALASILGGKVTIGVSSWSETEAQVKAGKLRVLAVSSESKLPAVDAPTLKESGIDVVVQNWRMVAAAPGITDGQKQGLVELMTKMNDSKAWKDIVAQKGWVNTFMAGPEFDATLKKEITTTTDVLKDLGLAS
jgi:putative tricarboxylic transport membrane protein